MISCRPKWRLGVPCTWIKCKCHCFDLFSSTGSVYVCHLHFLSESGHSSPRRGSHMERLLLLLYISGAWFPWQKLLILYRGSRQSRGSRTAQETSIRTCTFLIPCWFESPSINADCKMFPFCDFSVAACGTSLHFQCLPTAQLPVCLCSAKCLYLSW